MSIVHGLFDGSFSYKDPQTSIAYKSTDEHVRRIQQQALSSMFGETTLLLSVKLVLMLGLMFDTQMVM